MNFIKNFPGARETDKMARSGPSSKRKSAMVREPGKNGTPSSKRSVRRSGERDEKERNESGVQILSFDGEGEALEEAGMSDAIAQVASAKRLTPTVMANFLQEMQVQQMRMWQMVMAKLNDERKMATAK